MAVFAVLLLGAYLVWPTLFAEHVEGFSAQTQSLSFLFSRGEDLATHDLAYPLVSQFLFYSRSGVVDLLAALAALRGVSDDLNYRILTIAGLAALLVGSCRFARAWGVPVHWSLLALLATPGIVTLGFYFNDNVVAAGLAALALSLLAPTAGAARFTIAGLLSGAAIQCRLDSVLILPLVAGLGLMRGLGWAALLRAGLAYSAGLIVALAALMMLNGFSLIDALRVSRYFPPPAWGRLPGLSAVIYFFGSVAPILLLIGGIAELWKLTAWRDLLRNHAAGFWRVLVLGVYPLAIVLVTLRSATEMRYFLPLLGPLIGLHGGQGAELVVRALRSGGIPRIAAGVAAAAALILFAMPPIGVQVRDGPSALTGQLWMPPLWRAWQDAQAFSMARMASVVDALEARPAATVVTTHWNDEFYLRLRLIEDGFRDVGAEQAPPGCASVSVYRRERARIVHIRLEALYHLSPFPRKETAGMIIALAAHCPIVRAQPDAWLFTFGRDVADRIGRPEIADSRFPAPLELPLTDDLPKGLVQAPETPVLSAVRVSRAELLALGAVTDRENEDEAAMLARYRAIFRPLEDQPRR